MYSKLKYLHWSTLMIGFILFTGEFQNIFLNVENIIVTRLLSSYFFAVLEYKWKKDRFLSLNYPHKVKQK